MVGHGRLLNGRGGGGGGWLLSVGVVLWLSLVAWLGFFAGSCCR